MEKISSPCIGVCAMNEASGYCFGCARSTQEIVNWLYYSEEEKAQLIRTLQERKAILEAARYND